MNPFKYGSIVAGEYFFDRKEECSRIVKTLSGGNNIVLIAPRRYGKSSLVFKAINELENNGFTCIYYDFMPVYSKENFVETYAKAILKKQKNTQKILKSFIKWVTNIRPSLSFNQDGSPEISLTFLENSISEKTLEDVIELPEKLAANNNRYIVVIDEFQEINKLNGENFEKLLRSKIQLQKNVNYLFLGSRTHLLNDMFSNKNRPFYNSAMLMQINKLPEDETIAFLKDRFSLSNLNISKEDAAFIIEQASGIPYYIQLLAAEVWQTVIDDLKTINKDIIKQAAYRIVEIKQDYYLELFDKFSKYQKKLLKALTKNGHEIFSKEYTEIFRLSATSTTQKAVSGLIDTGIVDKEGNEYFINDPFFIQFLLRYTA